MAKVEITARISGTRDGVEWPGIGGVVDVPEDEAADLVRLGLAKPVAKAAERAVAPKAETRKQA